MITPKMVRLAHDWLFHDNHIPSGKKCLMERMFSLRLAVNDTMYRRGGDVVFATAPHVLTQQIRDEIRGVTEHASNMLHAAMHAERRLE